MLISGLEAKNATHDLAFFITKSGRLQKRSISAIAGRYHVSEFGTFFIGKRYLYKNIPVFFYDSGCPQSLDIAAMADVQRVLHDADKPSMTLDDYKENKSLFYVPTQQFLNEVRGADLAAIHDFWNQAQHSETKTKEDKKTLAGFGGGSWAIVLLDNVHIDIVKLKVSYLEGRKIGECKYGKWDMSDSQLRYDFGKAAVYFLIKPTEAPNGKLPVPVNMSASKTIPDFASFEPILVRRAEKEIRFTDRGSEGLGKKVSKQGLPKLIVIAGAFIAFLLTMNYVVNPNLGRLMTDQEREQNIRLLEAQAELEQARALQRQLDMGITPGNQTATPQFESPRPPPA
jgi:hypothetical protein